MKILQVNSSDTGGGAERVAYQMHTQFNLLENVSSHLLVRNKKRDDINIIELKRSFIDKLITRVINNFFSLQGKMALASLRFNKVIFNEKYDIVHYHNIHGNYYNFRNIEKISSRIPIVWTLHDMWAFTGRCAYSFDCTEWMKACGRCDDKLNSFPAMRKDNSLKVLNEKKKAFVRDNIYIVTPSKWLEGLVRQSFMKDMNIVTIYNGVDTKLYKYNDKYNMRKKYKLDQYKKYILLISADINDSRKGFKDIVVTLNKVENKESYEILIVGKELQDNIFDSRFSLRQFGYISDEKQLNEIYSLADVFIMPTLADNFPCTILESMASGTAVISYPIGGIPEQIDNEVGWLVDRNSNELLNIINNIDKEVCIEKGIRAREKVERYFTLEQCINNYLNLYKRII